MNFTEEEIKTAKAVRDRIIKDDISELKPVYMAGEIVMWDELKKHERERLVDFVKWQNEKNQNWLKHIDEKDVETYLKSKP